jgi:hypothetical protein
MQVELKTLHDAMEHFLVPENAIDYMIRLRWSEAPALVDF